ncbi:MAG: LUD domain-containing protein, partial [Gammaproteobacteria bacterium]|nr:LUD domain-containing protein [Gammaproteobacteria bacterium]
MLTTSKAFTANVHKALNDVPLQEAMNKAKGGFIEKRRIAIEALPEFDEIKRHGIAIKEDVLENLADYLEQFEQQVLRNGGHVHWAQSPAEARAIVIQLCKEKEARSIAKGKSMIGEEINLNEALEAEGFEPIETDLGEYIIQLAGEPPSHIIAPAVHKTKAQIVELFKQHHTPLGYTKTLETVPEIVNEAREIMRDKFLQADVGITGANFIIADTGSTMIVTNEGNGDLSSTLPKTHIVLASLEKIVPTLEDCSSLLRLLARSATGQETTTYTTFFNGPKTRPDGSLSEFHVVLVDNGRS